MKITKPKKHSSGTYEGSIYKNIKKELIKVEIENAKVIAVKHGSDSYIHIKSPQTAKRVCEINDKMLGIVKDKISSWFNNAMNEDLIDDYFISNVIYDKTHGQLIKFKIIEVADGVNLDELTNGKRVALTLSLQKLRFYKQKFVNEWRIEVARPITESFIDFEEHDYINDDIPSPNIEELESLKQHYMALIQKSIQSIDIKLLPLAEQKATLTGLRDRLHMTDSFSQISALCDQFDKIIE